MKVLVCGGGGYIGSHTIVELLAKGHVVVVVDNHINSSPHALVHVARIVGVDVETHHCDIRDSSALDAVFSRHSFDVVIHFASLKSSPESWRQPLLYYDNNVSGTISLVQAMLRARVWKLIFSSSAAVYGSSDVVPIPESADLRPTSPYARTKLIAEDILRELCVTHHEFQAAVLRYFNPVGAHPSGLIGDDPIGVPGNLMPYVCQVAMGRLPFLPIFGDDYPTHDGTAIRDYIHVVDLARAHVRALEHMSECDETFVVNVGTGCGHSVLDVVVAFEHVSRRRVPVSYMPRRTGDIARSVALPVSARERLGWEAEYDLNKMCQDAWRWQSMHPQGYLKTR